MPVISELNSQPCTPPAYASPLPYGKPTHDSGPQLIANRYHAGTFTPYSLPTFTGAFDLTLFYLHVVGSRFLFAKGIPPPFEPHFRIAIPMAFD